MNRISEKGTNFQLKEMRSIANKEAADMKLAADYRALARDALRGRWKTAVLAGLLASALGANIVNATENITSNANRANQNSNITPGGSLELFSQANGGRLLAVLVVCIVVWTLFSPSWWAVPCGWDMPGST